MPEGLSEAAVGKEIAEHNRQVLPVKITTTPTVGLSIVEAVLLSHVGLIGVGGLLLVFAVIQLIGLPAPPS